MNDMTWRTANNGSGKRRWFLIRGESIPLDQRYFTTRAGNLVRYASHEAAQKAADVLNKKTTIPIQLDQKTAEAILVTLRDAVEYDRSEANRIAHAPESDGYIDEDVEMAREAVQETQRLHDVFAAAIAAVSTTPAVANRPVKCRCVFDCADHPATACSLSGEWHVHPDNGQDILGPCPEHPDAPGDL